MFHSFRAMAEWFLDRGYESGESLDRFMKGPYGQNSDAQKRSLLIALLHEVKGLRRDIKSLPGKIERERVRAAEALAEKQRKEAEAAAEAPLVAAMKLADKQRRAAEAKVRADMSAPVEVVEASLPPREMERLVDTIIEKGGEFRRF